jgi:hypothetical protein
MPASPPAEDDPPLGRTLSERNPNSRAAGWMRQYRQRRAQGSILATLEVEQAGLDWLVRMGWLASSERGNRQAVQDALGAVINRAGQLGLSRQLGGR